jgi:hypothetical protein
MPGLTKVRTDEEILDARYGARDPRNAAIVMEAEALWWKYEKSHRNVVKGTETERKEAREIGDVLLKRGYKVAFNVPIEDIIYEYFLDMGIFGEHPEVDEADRKYLAMNKGMVV